jgi:hypothetical protein
MFTQWLGALLIGGGAIGITRSLRKYIDEQNKIEGKILLVFPYPPTLTIDSFNPMVQPSIIVHNCSNQIIEYEMIENENYFRLNGRTKSSEYSFDRTIEVIPPYTPSTINMYSINLDEIKDKLILDIKISIKYRIKDKNIEYKMEKIFNVEYRKISSDNKATQYLCVSKNHSS